MTAKQTGSRDPDYLDAIRNNDKRVLTEIYDKFFPGVARYIRQNSGREADAHDVFQEAMMVLFRKSKEPGFSIRQSFQSYLFTVCKQIWMNELRKKGRQGVTLDEVPTLTDDEDITATLVEREKAKLFRAKFAELKEDCQKLLGLFFERVKMEEITRKMGHGSVSYTKKRKFKCKERLIELIKGDPIYRELTNT